MTTTILITGATAGIGEATAKLLGADQNNRLILTGRRAERLAALAKTLPCETHLLNFDVRDRAATLAALASLPDAWKAVDVLVNNAGLALGLNPMDTGDFNDWQVMVETNILGLLTVSQTILPGMKARGRGHIITVGSVAGTYHYPGSYAYGGTKAFANYFSLALRADQLGAAIRVTSIEPGMTDTEFSAVRFKGDAAKASAVYEGLEPLHAENIAEAIRWAIAQPPHVNINRIELMPVMQAPAGLAVKRG